MISRDRHRIAPHNPFFGTVHVSKFQNVSVDKTLPDCLMLFSLYKINT